MSKKGGERPVMPKPEVGGKNGGYPYGFGWIAGHFETVHNRIIAAADMPAARMRKELQAIAADMRDSVNRLNIEIKTDLTDV